MDIILDGQVAVQNIDEKGNVLTIETFSVRDIIGANLIFSSTNRYPMTVMTVSRTTILHLKEDFILELCQVNLSFMSGLMRVISDKNIVLTNKISAISFKTIRESLIEYLKYECNIQKSNTIRLNTSMKELAERMGVQRTSLCRELNKMREGIVVKSRDFLRKMEIKTYNLL